MTFLDHIFYSLTGLRNSPFRTLLTIICFFAASSAPIFVLGISKGIYNQISEINSDPGRRKVNIYQITEPDRAFRPSIEDIKLLQGSPLNIEYVGGFDFYHNKTLRVEGYEQTVLVAGVYEQALQAAGREVLAGSLDFSAPHSGFVACKINENLSNALYQNAVSRDKVIIGQKISINGLSCSITGIVSPEPHANSRHKIVFLSGLEAYDHFVTQTQANFGSSVIGESSRRHVDRIVIMFDKFSYIGEQRSSLLKSLNTIRNDEANRLFDRELFASRFDIEKFKRTQTGVITFMNTIMIVILSFVVLCVGLSAYHTVKSRKKELTVLIALGANKGALYTQVVLENMVCVLTGMVLGMTTSLLVKDPFSNGTGLEMVVDLNNAVLALVIVLSVGLVSSIAPIRIIDSIQPAAALKVD